MTDPRTVYVVEDEPAMRRSLEWMIESIGVQSEIYESAEGFLDDAKIEGPSCLILDMRLPGMSGLDLLNRINADPKLMMPVIAFTGNGDVATAVQSMKLGVREFFEKPVDSDVLLAAVQNCLESDGVRRSLVAHHAKYKELLSRLSQRERAVLDHVCQGLASKQIAKVLGISIKTVENHRWHLMRKLGVSNAAEAVNLAHIANAA